MDKCSLLASKSFGLVKDWGERPLNTSQTSQRGLRGEKRSVAMLLSQQAKVLLALRIHADGNFLQVIGDTVGVNELTVFGRGRKPFEIKKFRAFL